MYQKLCATTVAMLACACSLALGVSAAAAAGTAPTTTTIAAASVTAVSASVEGTISPDGAAITAASFCYGTSPTLSSCTSAPVSSSEYSGLSVSSTGDPVYTSITGLTPNTTYYYSLSATNSAGTGTSSANGSFTTQAVGAFTCTPAFYQVSATGSGALYTFNASSNSFTQIGSGNQSGINGVGYDTADNYLYGIASNNLYQINNDGQFTNKGALSASSNNTGADFYNGALLETAGSGDTFDSINVSTRAVTAITMTNHVVGSVPASSGWGASDITVQGSYGYGLSSSSSSTTLYVADLVHDYIASIAVTGIPNATSGTDAYGAAFSDPDGNAYFYNNTTHVMYEVPSSALQAALTSGTIPAGHAIGSGATSPALSAANDGATCPNAASPYAPSVTAPTTGTVTTTSASVNAVVSPNDSALTDVEFCYSTANTTAANGGALTGAPTCVAVDQTAYPYTTWSGTNLYNVAATLTGLSGCTTYYYQSKAVNGDGTAYSTPASFTTLGCQSVSFSSSPPSASVVGDTYTPAGSATSGLSPVITVDASSSSVCSISGGVVTFNSAGTCLLDMNQPGDSSYAAAPQVQQTVTVNPASAPANQTVSFTSTIPGAPAVFATYTPTGSATSGLPAVITVDASSSSVCSINSGVVTFNATGSCVLDIDQAGNGNWNPAAEVQQTITVGRAAQTVSFSSPGPSSAVVGDTYTPSGTADSGLTPVISVDASSGGVCSINSGVVRFDAPGNCVLDIDQAGNADYTAASEATQTIAVSAAAPTPSNQTVSFTSNAPTAAVVGGTYAPAGAATSGLTPVISVDSSSASVCGISSGVVTFNAVGDCVLDIDQPGNGSWNAAPQVQQTVAVKSATVTTPTTTTPTDATPTASTPTVSAPPATTTTTAAKPAPTPEPTPKPTPTPKVDAPAITSVIPGNGQALIAWTVPAHPGTQITGYVVSTASGRPVCRTTSTTCLVSDLNNGSTYRFTVTALTSDRGSSAPSHPHGVTTSSAPVAAANGSSAPRGAARVISSAGTVSHVAVQQHGSTVKIGDRSFGLSLGLSAQSVNYTHTAVSMFSGSRAKIGGYGFLPNSTVTLYMSSAHVRLGTARVGRNGRFTGMFKVPATLKNGYHTLISTGITASRKRESVEGSVRVIAKTLLVVAPFGFNESNLTPTLVRMVQHDAQTIAFGGVTHVTISAYTDPRGGSSYNVALSQRRAASVAAQLRSDLSALHAANIKVVVLANGKADPILSGGQVVNAASRRAVITIT